MGGVGGETQMLPLSSVECGVVEDERGTHVCGTYEALLHTQHVHWTTQDVLAVTDLLGPNGGAHMKVQRERVRFVHHDVHQYRLCNTPSHSAPLSFVSYCLSHTHIDTVIGFDHFKSNPRVFIIQGAS